jgi:hypothetical protein
MTLKPFLLCALGVNVFAMENEDHVSFSILYDSKDGELAETCTEIEYDEEKYYEDHVKQKTNSSLIKSFGSNKSTASSTANSELDITETGTYFDKLSGTYLMTHVLDFLDEDDVPKMPVFQQFFIKFPKQIDFRNLFRRVGSLSEILFSFKNEGEIPDDEEGFLNLIFQFRSVGHSIPTDISINDQGTINTYVVHNFLESKEKWYNPYIERAIYSQKKLVYSPDHNKILLLTRQDQETEPEEGNSWELEKQFDLNAAFILRDHAGLGDWSIVVLENQYNENFYLINFAEKRNYQGEIEEYDGL